MLVFIRNLHYDKSDRKRLIMTTVEANFDLYWCAHHGRATDECYKIVVSFVDTINTNGGSAGLHSFVFKKYISPMKDKGMEKSQKDLSALTVDKLNVI